MQNIKLSEAQQQLIIDNLDNIRSTLVCMIRRLRPHLQYDILQDLTEAALAHSVEAAYKFSSNHGNQKRDFHKYAAFICYARTIDEGRRNNKMPPHKQKKKNEARERVDESVKARGFAENEEHRATRVNPNFVSLHDPAGLGAADSYHDTGLDRVDWEDTKALLIKRFNHVFGDQSPEKNTVYRSLLCDYLIPKVEGEEHPTLAQLALKLNISESRLSQIVHGSRFTRIIKDVLHDE
jgi:DNA-directed RNA polymerase specialized sigma subunit